MLFIRGTLAHTPVRGEVELLHDHLVVVDTHADGRIVAVVPGVQEAECLARHGGRPKDVLRLQVRCPRVGTLKVVPARSLWQHAV